MTGRDPLEALRTAWSELEPPPSGGLAQPDPTTRAVLDWMQAAWTVQSAPALPRPVAAFPWRLWAGAAAAVLVGIVTLASVPIDLVATGPGTEPALVRAPTLEPVQVVAATPERIEMRSGPVTLVLMTSTEHR